jgi:hypothetical protein
MLRGVYPEPVEGLSMTYPGCIGKNADFAQALPFGVVTSLLCKKRSFSTI